MAPPKPSQRGKFRPKKPQKKASKPPSTAATTGTALASSSPLPSITSSNPNDHSGLKRNIPSAVSSGGRSGGRGGRGRGGRGRGRGRTPIPQGTVFFTGGEKKTSSSTKGLTSKRIGTSASASRHSKKRDDESGKGNRDSMDTSNEEVVGQLDTAIGGSGNTKKESFLERDYGDYVEEEGPLDGAKNSMNLNTSAACMYDSDSSDERSARKSKTVSLISPVKLPFSSKSLSTEFKPDATNSSHIEVHNNDNYSEPAQPSSPFVAMNETQIRRNQNNSWFLVQLPTRLPPMQKDFPCHESANDAAEQRELINKNLVTDSTELSPATNNVIHNISEVAVPPVTTSCFDYGLDNNAPGRIGKIFVHKSGKTVLVMDGQDDKVRMNVNEGLTCMFHQEAAAVNMKEGHYIILGDVDKSIVISPDLSSI